MGRVQRQLGVGHGVEVPQIGNCPVVPGAADHVLQSAGVPARLPGLVVPVVVGRDRGAARGGRDRRGLQVAGVPVGRRPVVIRIPDRPDRRPRPGPDLAGEGDRRHQSGRGVGVHVPVGRRHPAGRARLPDFGRLAGGVRRVHRDGRPAGGDVGREPAPLPGRSGGREVVEGDPGTGRVGQGERLGRGVVGEDRRVGQPRGIRRPGPVVKPAGGPVRHGNDDVIRHARLLDQGRHLGRRPPGSEVGVYRVPGSVRPSPLEAPRDADPAGQVVGRVRHHPVGVPDRVVGVRPGPGATPGRIRRDHVYQRTGEVDREERDIGHDRGRWRRW